MNNNTIEEAAETTTTTRINVVEAEAEVKIEAVISTQSPNDMRKIKEPMVMSMTETKNSSEGVKANAAEEVVVAEDEEAEAVVVTPIEIIVKIHS